MGRSSKFAFPLPGRRSQPRRHVIDPLPHPPALPTHLPLLPDPLVADFNPSPKARRLLGAQSDDCSASSPANASSPLQRAVSPSLDSKRSYMSITVSDASQSSTSAYKTSTTVPPDPEIVQYAARTYAAAPDEPAPDPQSSTQAAKLKSKRSRLGFGTHYDPKKAPLSVSQQTSASAIAHGGLRRGHVRRHSSPNSVYHLSDDEEPSALPEDTDHPSAMDTPARRKASPKLDLSRLFNKPSNSKAKEGGADPVLSPTKFVTSPTSLSSNSVQFPAPEATLKSHAELIIASAGSNSARAENGAHPETVVPAEPRAPASRQGRVYRDACETAKIHVRRPPPGIQNWFDGLGESDDDEDEFEDDSESEWPLPEQEAKVEESTPQISYQPYRPPELGVEQFYDTRQVATPSQKSLRSTRSDSRLNVRENSRSRSRSRPRSKLSVEPRTQSRSVSRATERDDELHMSDAPLKISETLSPKIKSKKPSLRRNSSKLSHTDLKGASVLSLSSSSSDESETESHASSTDMPNIRESLSILTEADKEVEIQIGRARALEVTRPRQSLEHIRRASESPSECSARGSTTTATMDMAHAPSAPSSATSTEFTSARRPIQPRQLSTVQDDEEGRGSFYDTPNTSEPEKPAPQATRRLEDAEEAPKRKLMAVTREEEMLLELMRRKRASMAKQNFTDGYNTALKLEHQRGIILPLVEEFNRNADRRTSEQGLKPPGPFAAQRHGRTQSLSTTKVYPERSSSLRPSGEFLPSTVYKPPHPKHRTSSSISGTLASLNHVSYDSTRHVPPIPSNAMLPLRTSRPPQLPLNIFSPLDFFSPYSPSVMTTATASDAGLPSPRSPKSVFDSNFRESKALTPVYDSALREQDEFHSIPLKASDSNLRKERPGDKSANGLGVPHGEREQHRSRLSSSRRKSRDASPPKFAQVLARQPSFTYATAGLQRPTHPIWHHRNESREALESGFAMASPYNHSQMQTQILAVPSNRQSSRTSSRPQSRAYSSDGRPSTASPDSMLSSSTSTATMTTLSDTAHAISGPPGAIANGKPTVPVRLRSGNSANAAMNTTSTARHSNTPNFSQKLVGSNLPSCRTSTASGTGSGDRSSSSIDAASCRPRSSVDTSKSLRSSSSGVAITTTFGEGQDAIAYGVYGFGDDKVDEDRPTSVCEDVYAAWNSLGGGRAGLF